jgi:hypothetical protein
VGDPGKEKFPCDTKSDCLDGLGCVSGHCASIPAVEVNCGDSLDDDQDGLTDCADPDCNLKACGLDSVCCGIACKSLAIDWNNCGGCGLVCANLQPCVSHAVAATHSGACGCLNSTCPATQQCVNNAGCECADAGDCAPGEVCDTSTGHGRCLYP